MQGNGELLNEGAQSTHTLTPTQAFATHYAHTYVFHIFRHLPHSTLSYSLRYLHVRTHTHFQQPITGRQRILNADTEYVARTSKLTTQYISTTRTRSHLYRQLLRTIRTHAHTSRLHIVRQEYLHMRFRTHTHIYATNHHQTNKMRRSTSGGPKCPYGKNLSSLRTWQLAAHCEARTCIFVGATTRTISIKYDDLELASNCWFDVGCSCIEKA